MSLSSLGTIGGPLIATALLTPAATSNWTAILNAMGSFLVTNTLVIPGLMVAAGAAVTGLGLFQVVGSASALGASLASAAGSPFSDAEAITLWTAIAGALIKDMTMNAKANPVSFVAVPTGGPVTGTGLIEFPTPYLGAAIIQAINCTDAAGIAAWTTVGGIIETEIAALGTVLATPIGMASPTGGGPVTGSGTIV